MSADMTGGDITLSAFGGTALVVWVSVRANIALIRERAKPRRQPASHDGAVLTEIKALKARMAERHGTSHEFDIAFDEALTQLKGRVERIETRSAAGIATAPAEPTQRNGASSAQ